MLHHQGKFIQRGRGLGSIFGSIFRTLMPAARNIATKIINSPITRSIGQSAAESLTKAGMQTAADVLAGENVGTSIKRGLTTVGTDVLETARKRMTGGGKRRKSIASGKQNYKKLKYSNDIFG